MVVETGINFDGRKSQGGFDKKGKMKEKTQIKSIIKKLKVNPSAKLTKPESDIVLQALNLWEDNNSRIQKLFGLVFKEWALVYIYERERVKKGHYEACRKIAEAMGFIPDGKGRRSLISPTMAREIQNNYQGYLDAGLKSKDAVLNIFNNKNFKKLYQWKKPRVIADILRKAGFEKVWDRSYISSKEDG